MRSLVLAIAIVALLPTVSVAEPHAAVQAALDYQVPENTCEKPIVIAEEKSVAPPTQDSGSASFFEGSSTASVSDIDGYSRKRLERKEKRRQKCVAKYKKGLLRDMETLKASAEHGLTQNQAAVVLGNMALIQKVYMTQNGVLEAEPNQPDNSGDPER